jgi:Tol biopolymer transport system component
MSRERMRIVFVIFILCALGLGGNRVRRVPKELCEGTKPTFSPDGKYLAFENDYIFTIDLANGEQRRVSDVDRSDWPSWSPDGRKLIFQSLCPHTKQTSCIIWIVNRDGSDLHQVVPPSNTSNHTPCFSPDGRSILWSREEQLWTADSSGKNPHLLTHLPKNSYVWACGWSHDGKTIAFITLQQPYTSDEYKIGLIDSNGQNQRIFLEKKEIQQARWSRDGASLYILCGLNKIIKVDIKSSQERTVCFLKTDADVGEFDVAPDEKSVAFELSEPESESKIVIQPISSDSE